MIGLYYCFLTFFQLGIIYELFILENENLILSLPALLHTYPLFIPYLALK